jgi:hypothetical protein
MERDEAFTHAKDHARQLIDAGELGTAVATYVGILQKARIHPPLHHADITHGILLAEAGDPAKVREWIEKFA